jgi:hypothetical protein
MMMRGNRRTRRHLVAVGLPKRTSEVIGTIYGSVEKFSNQRQPCPGVHWRAIDLRLVIFDNYKTSSLSKASQT